MNKNDKSLKDQLKSFERKQFLAMGFMLFLLVIISIYTNSLYMTGAAQHTARLITRLNKIADFRDLSLTLQDARLDYFSKIHYHSNSFNRSFTLPPISDYLAKEHFLKAFIFAEIVVPITTPSDVITNQDKIFFEYNRFNFTGYALGFWFCLLAFSIPQSKLIKRRISKQYEKEINLYKVAAENSQRAERAKVYEILAKQVAHDIRSPLSALTMVASSLKDIPEDKRLLIRNATQRINDIANDLLQKARNAENSNFSLNPSKNPEGLSETDVKPQYEIELSAQTSEFIPAIIDIMISEKRMQYREYAELEIEVDLKNSFGAFAKVNSKELKRVISNLVNNAVEAFANFQGKITVGVCKVDIENSPIVEIYVKDNGKGMPQDLIEKIGKAGVSFGKDSSSQSGSGLGLYHAQKTMESFGGSLRIESTEGFGSTIYLTLPLAVPPAWFAEGIDLTGKKYLVSLDDDISIHQIWAGRLQSANIRELEHIKFQSSDAFEKYVHANIGRLTQTLFLIDYELLNQPKTGLAIIEELGLEKYSILVTSRYEESEIQSKALQLKLPLLPKSLSGFVPIIRNSLEKYDWVLLDDDELVHLSWSYAAKETNRTFLGFRTPEQLEAYKNKLDRNSNIYIDSNLGNNVKGEEIARKLFADNFRRLYLATGYASDQFSEMTFITAIVGKEPPVAEKI